jgi:hypothetical protein
MKTCKINIFINRIYILGGRKSFIDEMNTDEEKT